MRALLPLVTIPWQAEPGAPERRLVVGQQAALLVRRPVVIPRPHPAGPVGLPLVEPPLAVPPLVVHLVLLRCRRLHPLLVRRLVQPRLLVLRRPPEEPLAQQLLVEQPLAVLLVGQRRVQLPLVEPPAGRPAPVLAPVLVRPRMAL